MNYFLIETLTPLHTGSGRMLQGNTEYLYFSDSATVSVIDEHKILALIGAENMDKWLSLIENEGDLLNYLKQRNPSLQPTSTHKRLLRAIGDRKPSPQPDRNDSRKIKYPTIREQLFSGNGQPLLAGSSLKGAIRTALFNGLILTNPRAAQRIDDFKRFDERKRKNVYNGQKLETRYFTRVSNPGEAPNHDVLRLLRIGDAHFDETVCLLSETLNEKGDQQQEIKESVKQLIECIPAGAETICRVQIPDDLKREINKREAVRSKMGDLNGLTFTRIFEQINQHTKRLIGKELTRYNAVNLPERATDYTEKLTEFQDQPLFDNQCIIRVGFGTGYLNMTGGWAEEQWKLSLPPDKFREEMADLAEGVRRNSRYNSFALPKSRKIALGGIPLGFLKLTLLDDAGLRAYEAKAVERAHERTTKAVAEREQAEEAARLTAEAEQKRLEEARVKAEEAKKPQLFEGRLKKGQLLDAEIILSARTNKVKVYASGYESQLFDLIGYVGAEPVGRVVLVKVDQLGKKDVLQQVRYDKIK